MIFRYASNNDRVESQIASGANNSVSDDRGYEPHSTSQSPPVSDEVVAQLVTEGATGAVVHSHATGGNSDLYQATNDVTIAHVAFEPTGFLNG